MIFTLKKANANIKSCYKRDKNSKNNIVIIKTKKTKSQN